jgi:TonB family protein
MTSKKFQLAYYGGGRDSMYKFIGDHFKYNPDFKGYLTIAYTVDANGKAYVTNINHNLNNNADKVPIDSVENSLKAIFPMMTKWRPGKNGDQPASSDFVQTFSFPMQSNRYPYLDTKAYFPADGGLYAFEDKVVSFPKGHGSSKGGTVYVQATIDAQGSVVNPMILRRDGDVASKDFDNEAYRVVKMMTSWVPAKLSNGKPVDTTIEIPVVFKRSAP